MMQKESQTYMVPEGYSQNKLGKNYVKTTKNCSTYHCDSGIIIIGVLPHSDFLGELSVIANKKG